MRSSVEVEAVTIPKMHSHSGSTKITLIFDGDDTLWRTMPLYTRAKARFFSKMERLGFNRYDVEHTFELRDAKNVDRWGFTVERFRRSMIEVLEEFLLLKNEVPRPRLAEQISQIATSVSRNKVRRLPGAYATLRLLQTTYRIVLLTKGEYSLQERRISESGLAGFLASVFIVEHKDRSSFERVCTDLSLDLNFTWSIGDSLRSDIKPALAAGLGAFWISQATWTYENADDESHRRLIRLKSISQLPRALRKVEQSGDVHL